MKTQNEIYEMLEVIELGEAVEKSRFTPVYIDNHRVSATIKITGYLEKAVEKVLPIVDSILKERFDEYDNQTRISTLARLAENASCVKLSDYDMIIFNHIVNGF